MGEPIIRLALAYDEATRPVPSFSGITAEYRGLSLPAKELSEIEEEFASETDAFALLVDAQSGISSNMIRCWQYFAERQYPRLLLVQGLEFAEADFDDIVLIGNRVLEPFATPYLVLHDDLGQPIGLYELASDAVFDFSGSTISRYQADADLQELVSEFKIEQEEEFPGGAEFASGLNAVAIPVAAHKPIGIAEINALLATLPKR